MKICQNEGENKHVFKLVGSNFLQTYALVSLRAIFSQPSLELTLIPAKRVVAVAQMRSEPEEEKHNYLFYKFPLQGDA